MQQKLPENIDQMEDFYKEQFQDFSPEVNNAVWENISYNIPTSTSVGTSVSTSYLLKVVGLMLGGIGTIAVVTDSFNTEKTKPAKEEIIIPTVVPTIEPVVVEPAEISKPEEIEDKAVIEKTTPIEEVETEKATTTSQEVKTSKNNKKVEEESKTKQSDFQFVEEIEFE